MKILVIGAKGMLGQEFVNQLKAKAMKRLSDGAMEVIGWGREDLDITKEKEVAQKIGQLKPAVVINCAAYNNVDKAEDEPEVAMAINGEAVGYLARAAAQCSTAFVHFSTDYVFDGEKENGYREDDAPNPISKYGESKLLGEQRLFAISQTRNFANFYLIRTSKLFGPAGSGVTSKKSFPEIMIKIAREKGRVEAVDAEAGSPTYVKDLAQATLSLIGIFPAPDLASARSPSPALTLPSPLGRGVGGEGRGKGEGYPSGIYHLTNSGSCTWYEYAKVAIKCTRVAAEVIPVGPERFPRKAKRPENSTLLNTKLPPLRAWQDALREYLIQQ